MTKLSNPFDPSVRYTYRCRTVNHCIICGIETEEKQFCSADCYCIAQMDIERRKRKPLPTIHYYNSPRRVCDYCGREFQPIQRNQYRCDGVCNELFKRQPKQKPIKRQEYRMPLYSTAKVKEGVRFVKWDENMDIEAVYTVSGSGATCDCPAGRRPTCRHRKMYWTFLQADRIGSEWYLRFDDSTWHRLPPPEFTLIEPEPEPMPLPVQAIDDKPWRRPL